MSGGVAQDTSAPPPRVDLTVIAILTFALGCSLLRLGLFVFRSEHLGVDPVLALVATAVSAYDLRRTLQG